MIQITEENFMKAHKEGCSDVKKTLETLAPELFRENYPCLKKYKQTGLIVFFTRKDAGYVLTPDKFHYKYEFSDHWCEWNFVPCEIKEAT